MLLAIQSCITSTNGSPVRTRIQRLIHFQELGGCIIYRSLPTSPFRHCCLSSSSATATPAATKKSSSTMIYPQQQEEEKEEHPQYYSLDANHHHHQHNYQQAPLSTSLSPPPAHVVRPPTAFFNGVNPRYPGVRLLYHDPPVFSVKDFLTPEECRFLIDAASDSFAPAPVVGRGVGEVSPTRTSSTCYLAREDLPDLMRKVSCLTGRPMVHMELPQVGRYLPSQQYYQHYDAFNLEEEDGRRFAANGGQRTVTVLIYLNDVPRGGQTSFPSLRLEVAPVRGTALVFFPATLDGALDPRALHAAMPAVDPKFVSQVWVRQHNYYGQPSKRLVEIMGLPLAPEETGAVPLAGSTAAAVETFVAGGGSAGLGADTAATGQPPLPWARPH